MANLDTIPPIKINKTFFESNNLAEFYTDNELGEICDVCLSGYQTDYDKLDNKRRDWNNFCKLASNEIADKIEYNQDRDTYKRSNANYPLLSKAAIAFSSYALPAILQDDQLIKCKVRGNDDGYGTQLFGLDGQTPLIDPEDNKPIKIGKGLKNIAANNIAKLLNTQLMQIVPNFEDILDKTVSMLPITGVVFHKICYSVSRRIPIIDLVLPQYLTINEDALNLEDASRITEEYLVNTSQLEEYIRTGTFLNCEYDKLETMHRILEQHTFLDLDQDGYAEPYIVWIYAESGKILRILPRFTENDIVRDKLNIKTAKDESEDYDDEENKGDIIYITAQQYYIKYGLIPDPKGSIYDIGFGQLLNSISAVVDTNLNQIIDAASIRIKGGGIFSGRLQSGQKTLRIGEWLQASDTTLGAPQLIPFPTAEPPQVLLQLLQQLISNAEEIVSIAGISVSKLPPNMPATTILAAIEQSTQNYKAILKRIYRGIKKLAQTLLVLDKKYLLSADYAKIIPNGTIEDLKFEDFDIIPYADPDSANNVQNSLKANFLAGLMQDPLMNQIEIRKYILKTLNIEDEDKFIVPPQAPQPSELDIKQVQALDAQIAESYARINDMKERRFLELVNIESNIKKNDTQAIKNLADAESKVSDTKLNTIDTLSDHIEKMEAKNERLNAADAQLNQQNLSLNNSVSNDQEQSAEQQPEPELQEQGIERTEAGEPQQ